MKDSSPSELIASPADAAKRLDVVVKSFLDDSGLDLSRSRIQELIKNGSILLNRKPAKAKTEVSAGDSISIELPHPKSTAGPQAETMALRVIFEDEDIIIIDKLPGLVVHPGSGNESGTLVNGLLHHCGGNLSFLADEGRPGIVHRLDKETSGCLVAAKSDLAYRSLVDQFSGRSTGKVYVAITSGIPALTKDRIENRIGRHPVHRQKMAVVEAPAGKEAITDYEVRHFSEKEKWSWLECRIHTGRTHQIRVHLKEVLRCPILGDTIYAQPHRQEPRPARLMLHAWKLEIQHPKTGARLFFEAPLPTEFERFLAPQQD